MDSENNPSKTNTGTQTKKLFRKKHTTKNRKIFVIDKISNKYIASHNKKYHMFLFKCDFKLNFNNDPLKPILIETDFYHKTSLLNLKRYLLHQIDNFIDKGYEFLIDEMNITTVNDNMFMACGYYITYPMPAVELKLNKMFSKNPHLIKAINRFHIHPLIRKYSYIHCIFI